MQQKDFKSKIIENAFSCDDEEIKEYYEVEVINNKYNIHGVLKGMKGIVFYDKPIDNKWLVIFKSQKKSRVLDIQILGNDLKIIKKQLF